MQAFHLALTCACVYVHVLYVCVPIPCIVCVVMSYTLLGVRSSSNEFTALIGTCFIDNIAIYQFSNSNVSVHIFSTLPIP